MIKKNLDIANVGHIIASCLFVIILLAIIADIFIFSDSIGYPTKKNFLFSNRILLIISLGICIILSFLIKNNQENYPSNDKFVFILIVANLLLFIFQLIVIFNMFFYSGWDAGGIRDSVFEIVNGTYNIWYPFSRFPSNINITVFMVVIVKMFSFFGLDGYSGILIVSALFVNLAGMFTFLCTYRITHSINHSVFSWIVFALLVALSPWISIPYSDTYSILFPILAFYLYVSIKPETKFSIRWFWIGLVCFFGYTIKPTVIIVLVAIIIVESWKALLINNKKIWINLLFSFILITLSVFPVLIINSYSNELLGVELNNEEKFSMYHLAMMGLNADTIGVYSQDDVNSSASFKTVEGRNNANIEIIEQRIKSFGLIGYLKFLGKKALVNFSDGSFAWSIEGTFYQTVPERSSGFAMFLKNLYYSDGTHHSLFLTFEQMLWFIVLLLLSAMNILGKKFDNNKTTLMLVIIGFIAAVMIFEARARYAYHVSPFFIVGASIGLSCINEKIKKKNSIGFQKSDVAH
jgi:hypothetical protein